MNTNLWALALFLTPKPFFEEKTPLELQITLQEIYDQIIPFDKRSNTLVFNTKVSGC